MTARRVKTAESWYTIELHSVEATDDVTADLLESVAISEDAAGNPFGWIP